MTTVFDATTTLGDLVTARPGLAPLLERLGLDYCCGGRRSLADAVAAAGLDLGEVIAAIGADGAGPAAADWTALGLAELVDHIEATHHAYLDEALPRLGGLVDKVVGVHGASHPELGEVQELFEALRADLEPHLRKEERILFPMIRQLADAEGTPSFHCGSLVNPIRVMLAEHDTAGELLAALRSVTDGYAPPVDACGSYRALYAGLGEIEADTHLHIHKENNVLFPAVLAAESALSGGVR